MRVTPASSKAFILSLISRTSLAGTTGKIRGVVKDKKNGEPLIGANVRVEGRLVKSSDADSIREAREPAYLKAVQELEQQLYG